MTSCAIPNIELSISILSSDNFWPTFSYGGPAFVYSSCDSGLRGIQHVQVAFLGEVLFSLVGMSHRMVQLPSTLHYYSDQNIRAEVELEHHSGTKNIYAGAQGWFRIYRLMESFSSVQSLSCVRLFVTP